MTQVRRRRPQTGRCMICGCTHWRPCAEGCGWANAAQTVCTRCVKRVGMSAALVVWRRRLARPTLHAYLKEMVW
jgi:hypothetical protein